MNFSVNWIVDNEIAISRAPKNDREVIELEEKRIKSVLSLCSEKEILPPQRLKTNFSLKRVVLPDHKSYKKIELGEIIFALKVLKSLEKSRPTLVHCKAGIERSPLICIAWLIKIGNLSPIDAFDFVIDAHPLSNPIPSQLALVFGAEFKKVIL